MKRESAITEGRTIFVRSRRDVRDYPYALLKRASGNAKLGKGSNIIVKSKWKGMPLYTLTLEERATCPKACEQWGRCFGNNMMFAHRITGDPELLMLRLADELGHLSSLHPDGYVIRLHVLGDFFSLSYVQFWIDALRHHPALRVFGYTHRRGSILEAIRAHLQCDRAIIRSSDTGGRFSANVNGEGITCPEQTAKTESCLTCGLCWQTDSAIRFLPH